METACATGSACLVTVNGGNLRAMASVQSGLNALKKEVDLNVIMSYFLPAYLSEILSIEIYI